MSTQDLNQSTIDSLFAAATTEQKFAAVNFQNRRSLTAEQMHLLVAANQVFGRSASAKLSSWLNVEVRIAMITAERMLSRDHLEVIDMKAMYFGEARFTSPAPALVCIDISFVNSIINLLLGGPANVGEAVSTREVTAIDGTVMGVFLSTLWAELNQIWSPYGLQADFKSEIHFANVGKVFSQTDYLLVLTYEMKINHMEGVLQIALSTTVADTLLRELNRRDMGSIKSVENKKILEDRVAKGRHRAYLRSEPFRLSVGEVANLVPGSLLSCGISQSTLGQFGIAGGKVWGAIPSNRNGRIVAQLEESHKE
jgi:flagellar motor switch protein FliM